MAAVPERNMTRTAFPQTPDQFGEDARVSFSKLDNKWILEDDDGSEWEFAEKVGKWIPSLDETLVEQQREAYAVPGIDQREDEEGENRKRKKRNDDSGNKHKRFRGIDNGDGNDDKSKNSNDHPKAERKNTAVYVTCLPPDATVGEVVTVFSKYGVIAEEIDSGLPRVRLYTDEQGTAKGDALVVYFRAESVQLAIQMLDDTDFRLGEPGPTGKMRVKEADFSYKKQKEVPTTRSAKDKNKIMRKTQKMNSKLADWDDDDPATIQDTNSKWEKVAILKHMFTLKELEDDPAAILDIKEDIREECSKLGQVTNVVLYDKEAEGVASIRFSTAQAAAACVRLMNGRLFGGQQVKAYIADGSERFKKTNENTHAYEDEDDENEESKRLDQFGSWLEEEEKT